MISEFIPEPQLPMAILIGSGMDILTNWSQWDTEWPLLGILWRRKKQSFPSLLWEQPKKNLSLSLEWVVGEGDVWGACGSHVAKKRGEPGATGGWKRPPHRVGPEVEDNTAEARLFQLELERPEPWRVQHWDFWSSFTGTRHNSGLSVMESLYFLQCLSVWVAFSVTCYMKRPK